MIARVISPVVGSLPEGPQFSSPDDRPPLAWRTAEDNVNVGTTILALNDSCELPGAQTLEVQLRRDAPMLLEVCAMRFGCLAIEIDSSQRSESRQQEAQAETTTAGEQIDEREGALPKRPALVKP